MKRKLLIFFLSFTSMVIFAQTQQGIVKTRGRMVNGQVVAGTRLTGATITLNIGNPLVSGQNGTFSFNVPSGKNYSLVTAKKQGYTLADPEYTRRSFKYSASNPFYVVLEDEAQRQADIKEATDKVRKNLKREIRKREDELDELRESNSISQAKYDSLRIVFHRYRQNSEGLVQEMAERYASTDYDQLDEFNRQVQMYIEEGELQKADSMIRSKGDMAQRVAEYHTVVAANKKEREMLDKREKQLEQSEDGAAKAYEDISQDLLRHSEIFLQAYKQDSALYCLKMRADLDTTNIVAVKQYAELCLKQNKFKNCENYYWICLRRSIIDNDSLEIADIYNCIGNLYSNRRDYTNAEHFYMLSLSYIENLSKNDNARYRANIANTQNNLSILYGDIHDYERCEHYAKMSLENYEIVFKENPEKYRKQYAIAQQNIGRLYWNLKDYEKCEMYSKLALENFDILFQLNPDEYRLGKANTHNNLGILYMQTRDYKNSEIHMRLGLELKEQLCMQNPDAYTEDLARTLKNIGSLYQTVKNYQESEKYYKLALSHIEILFHENPNIYRSELAAIQNNIGVMYLHNNDYDNSKHYLVLALENKEKIFLQNANAYRLTLAMTQNNLVSLCMKIPDYGNCIKYGLLLLGNLEELAMGKPGKYSNDIAATHHNIAQSYLHTKQYDEAICSIDKAILLLPTKTPFYDTKGEILLMQGKNKEALEMWKKVMELNPNFLDENPNGTELSNGLKKLGLIE